MLHLVRDVQNHESGQIELLGAVGEHPLDALPVGHPFAERHPPAGAGSGHVKRRLGFRDTPHAVPESAVAEPVLPHRKALPDAADDAVPGHLEVANANLCVSHRDLVSESHFRVLAEHGDVAHDLEAITSANCEMLAPEVNHFSPLRIQFDPTGTAVVCMPVASAPAAFSVMAKQTRRSPLTSGTR
jgi:hypothetical protein